MTKITELTPEQDAKLSEYRDKWIALGQSTGATDRDKAGEAIALAYQCANLPPPKIKLWLKSPQEGLIAAWWLKQLKMLKGGSIDKSCARLVTFGGDKVLDQIGSLLRNTALNQAKTQLRGHVGTMVEAKVKEKLTEPVKIAVRDPLSAPIATQIKEQLKPDPASQMWTQVWIQVWTQLWTQVWGAATAGGVQMGTQVRAEILQMTKESQVLTQIEDLLSAESHGEGLHEAPLLASYDFFAHGLGIDISVLAGLTAAAEHCGWYWPFGGIAIMTDKPSEVLRDPKGRIHSDSGPAIKYADGWGAWMWFGTRVDSWIVTNPEKITLDTIDKEKNGAVRRVMRERFGLQEYFLVMVKEGKAKRIGRRKDEIGQPMALFRYDEKEGPIFFAHVYNGAPEQDGTHREFVLPCKNVADDPLDSLNATYPDMMKELKGNPRRFEMIKSATRG